VRSFFRLLLVLAVAGSARADPALEAALQLYHAKHYPEAQAALEAIVRDQPQNAEACHALGMTLRHHHDPQALDDAVPWLERAATLAPDNAVFQADYGGTCLELADKHRSLSFATRGCKAMEKAVRLNPNDLDARDGLMEFYARAPWPLGSKSRARHEAEEIARRDPRQGLQAYLDLGRSFEKAGDRTAAREAYATAHRLDAGNSAAAAGLARLGGVDRVPAGP
jgi:tetratricopeptide (TPR) repeat protein